MSDLYELLIEAETDAKFHPIHFLKPAAKVDDTPVDIDFKNYDRVVLGFSGGKDSVAAVLHLLDCGVDPSKIELHHHLVDGRESTLMDWPVTESYCRKFAHAFGMKIYMSWKVGGFEREMLRNDSKTAPVAFDSEDGTVHILGGNAGKNGTRMKFPQVTANLTQRWCSSYIKISVCDRILMNEPRFRNGKTLVVTGERAEESASRAHYEPFEPDRADNRNGLKVQRFIDHARPVHSWKEAQVWEIMERYKVNPHPAYWLGWGRTSCRNCIFNNANM